MNRDPYEWQDAAAGALAQELDSAAPLQAFPLDPASELASRLELLVPTLLQAVSRVWDAETLDGLLDGRVILDSALSGRIVAAAVVMSTQTLAALEIDYTLTDGRDGFDQLDVRLGQTSPDEPLGIRHHGLSQAVNVLHDLEQSPTPFAWAYSSGWTRRPVNEANRRSQRIEEHEQDDCPACGASRSQSTDPDRLWSSVCYCGHPRYYDYRHLDGSCPCLR